MSIDLQKHKATILAIKGLNGCSKTTFDDIKLPKIKCMELKERLHKAPTSGKLLVTGTICPIVNEMFDLGKTMVGISFPEFYESRFSDEPLEKPNGAQVIFIRAVGKEPAKNSEYASKLLQGLLEYYSNHLVIIETMFTKTSFESTYGISINNHLTLHKKEEDNWLL